MESHMNINIIKNTAKTVLLSLLIGHVAMYSMENNDKKRKSEHGELDDNVTKKTKLNNDDSVVHVEGLTDKQDINVRDLELGQTLFMEACQTHDDKLIKMLCEEKNPNIDLQDDDGNTPLMLYLKQSNSASLDIIKLLTNNNNINKTNNDGLTALLYAKNTDLKVMFYLIEHGADINQCNNKYSVNLLMSICAHPNLNPKDKNSFIQFLCREKNANIDLQDINGNTSLMRYISSIDELNLDLNVIKLLTSKNNINKKTNEGLTALLLAYQKHIGIVPYLITNGANINQCDKNGYTVLTYACLDKRKEVRKKN